MIADAKLSHYLAGKRSTGRNTERGTGGSSWNCYEKTEQKVGERESETKIRITHALNPLGHVRRKERTQTSRHRWRVIYPWGGDRKR